VFDLSSSRGSTHRQGHRALDQQRQGKIIKLPKGYLVQEPVVIMEPVDIGEGTFIGCFTFIRARTTIGKNSVIGDHCQIMGDCSIGDRTHLLCNAHVSKYSKIGSDCFIGPNFMPTNCLHPFCPEAKRCSKEYSKGVTIDDRVKIGANVVTLPGVHIGHDAFVGALSLVNKDVSPFSLVVGIPARKIGDARNIRCKYGVIDKPYR
jgi:UDP-2-acetamido-3-amino-2,3-dideoxy-glucuronate N-acetyltransferase